MKPFPATPDAADAPDDALGEGHLWLLEWIDGAPLRFRLRESGALELGGSEGEGSEPSDSASEERRRPASGDEQTFGDDPPARYRHAVRHVRERLDREALRASADDVEAVVFFGVATQRRSVDYDWATTPSFFGVDVWAGDRGDYLPPDRAAQAFDELGLARVDALEKEVRAADFDPDAYEFPSSAWRDGPVAGVLARSKTGDRVRLPNPDATGPPVDLPGSAREIAERYVTRRRLERIAAELESLGRPVTTDRLSERVVDSLLREVHGELLDGGNDVSLGDVRSEAARITARYLQAEFE